MVFFRNLCEKRQLWVSEVSELHFGQVGVAQDLGWWLGKPMVNFLFALVELSSPSVMVLELWGQMCTARLFSLFALKFYPNGVIPHQVKNHSQHQKTRDTGLPDREDHIRWRTLVLTQYRSVTDGQMDGRICRSIYIVLEKLALRSSVKTLITRMITLKSVLWKRLKHRMKKTLFTKN